MVDYRVGITVITEVWYIFITKVLQDIKSYDLNNYIRLNRIHTPAP